jgi:endonuclease VIII-like 1
LLNQKYFNGIGNYLRSTILYYSNINPFETAREVIIDCGERLFEFCKDIPLKAYRLNGGQLKDWSNPFELDSKEFSEWVYYKKGNSIKDSNGRTFWYNPKWDNMDSGNNI